MENFEISVAFENGKLYIHEEDGSGVSYSCKSAEEIGQLITEYIKDMEV